MLLAAGLLLSFQDEFLETGYAATADSFAWTSQVEARSPCNLVDMPCLRFDARLSKFDVALQLAADGWAFGAGPMAPLLPGGEK
eukprot:4955284-Pyramimonas_sp.AAC.1